MANNTTPITWKGDYAFLVSGSGLHEDTLRIESSSPKKQERLFRLVLPTLCITFADAAFQDSVGGQQENYPASRAYGPSHFDPPVELVGEREIEKFTYIRGAQRVEIGSKETVVEFPSWKDLVIPRLRIDEKKPARFNLHVPETPIEVDEPLRVSALQYADGRHVGGVRLEKRHPKWQPVPEKERYSLWIRVIDGRKLVPIPEARLAIWRWDAQAGGGRKSGAFRLADQRHTDGDGCVQVANRPSGELEAYVVNIPGARAVARRLRPLAGQNVRLHMRVWPLKRDEVRYVWQAGDRADVVAGRAGLTVDELLALNGFKGPRLPKAGIRISLPCYVAEYFPEPWDTFDRIGEMFGYRDAEGLAAANGLRSAKELDGGIGVKLPDWRFLYAHAGDTLTRIDAMFGVPPGSSVTVGRVFHPDPDVPLPGETVAVPTPRFAETLAGERTNR